MTAQYFIDKFEAIPEALWITQVYRYHNNEGRLYQCCALGHCGADPETETPESVKLQNMFQKYLAKSVTVVNDSFVYPEYRQDTPKQRILAALHDIKKLGG